MEDFFAKYALVKLLKRVYAEDANDKQSRAYNEIVLAEMQDDTATLLKALDALIDFCTDIKKSLENDTQRERPANQGMG